MPPAFTSDLNCKSLPLTCLKTPLPVPRLLALVIIPAPLPLEAILRQVFVSPKYASILCVSVL